MKTIIDNYSIFLKPLKIEFNDIKKIFEVLSEVSKDYEIKTNETQFDNLEELTTISDDVIYDLNLISHSPFVSVQFKKNGSTHLYIEKNTLELRGALEKINNILKPKQVKLYNCCAKLAKVLKVIFCITAIPILFLLNSKTPNKITIISVFIYFGLLISFVIFWASYGTYVENRYNRIYLHGKKDTFWKRNKDSIIVGIITTIVSGIVSFIAGYFVGK